LHPALGYGAGWVSLLVGFSAPLAFAAFAFGEYSKPWWPGCPPKLSGSVLVVALSAIHAAHVKRGAWVQNVTVALKVALIAVFIGLAWARLEFVSQGPSPPVPISTFAVALTWVSFSYSGWNAAIYIGGEILEPEGNLPRALILGTALVTVLYLAINTVFVYAAPMSQLAGKAEVGRIAAGALGGAGWANAVGSLVALVLVSSISAQIMAGPRVYAQMAADGYLPRWLTMGAGPPRPPLPFKRF
jgi:APA family basic amino acid/polyamine antiporter